MYFVLPYCKQAGHEWRKAGAVPHTSVGKVALSFVDNMQVGSFERAVTWGPMGLPRDGMEAVHERWASKHTKGRWHGEGPLLGVVQPVRSCAQRGYEGGGGGSGRFIHITCVGDGTEGAKHAAAFRPLKLEGRAGEYKGGAAAGWVQAGGTERSVHREMQEWNTPCEGALACCQDRFSREKGRRRRRAGVVCMIV